MQFTYRFKRSPSTLNLHLDSNGGDVGVTGGICADTIVEKKQLIEFINHSLTSSESVENQAEWLASLQGLLQVVNVATNDKGLVSSLSSQRMAYSTSTMDEITAATIAVLDTCESYYKYQIRTECGWTHVRLMGVKEDWSHLVAFGRSLPFEALDMQTWQPFLRAFLNELEQTAMGNGRREFWSNMFQYNEQSGSNSVSGSVQFLFPWLKNKQKAWWYETGLKPLMVDSPDGKTVSLWHKFGSEDVGEKKTKRADDDNDDDSGEYYEKVQDCDFHEFPTGVSETLFNWLENGTSHPMKMCGGFGDATFNDDRSETSPSLGWLVTPVPKEATSTSKPATTATADTTLTVIPVVNVSDVTNDSLTISSITTEKKLTPEQEAIIKDIVAGGSVLICGKRATGKTFAHDTAFKKLHVAVRDAFDHYCIKLNPNASTMIRHTNNPHHPDFTGEIESNPIYELFKSSMEQDALKQAQEDAEHKGLRKVQICRATAHKELSDPDTTLEKFIKLAEEHPDNGRPLLVSLNSDYPECSYQLLRSTWFERNHHRFQFVGSVLLVDADSKNGITRVPFPDDITAICEKLGVIVHKLDDTPPRADLR